MSKVVNKIGNIPGATEMIAGAVRIATGLSDEREGAVVTPSMIRSGFGYYEDTIEDLKNRKGRYKFGDVVEVLGYHTKGDGAHHKRIAKAEDDGSGEQGQNGVWWCIVHSGEVNVSWFGAKGDGLTDDTEVIQKTLNYGAIVKLDKNKTYLTGEIAPLSCSIDGNDCYIYMKSNVLFNLDNYSTYGNFIKNIRISGSKQGNVGTAFSRTKYSGFGSFELSNILIDNVTNGIIFENSWMLNLNKVRVQHCSNGIKLINSYASNVSDIIISDFRETGMSIGGNSGAVKDIQIEIGLGKGIVLNDCKGIEIDGVYCEQLKGILFSCESSAELAVGISNVKANIDHNNQFTFLECEDGSTGNNITFRNIYIDDLINKDYFFIKDKLTQKSKNTFTFINIPIRKGGNDSIQRSYVSKFYSGGMSVSDGGVEIFNLSSYTDFRPVNLYINGVGLKEVIRNVESRGVLFVCENAKNLNGYVKIVSDNGVVEFIAKQGVLAVVSYTSEDMKKSVVVAVDQTTGFLNVKNNLYTEVLMSVSVKTL